MPRWNLRKQFREIKESMKTELFLSKDVETDETISRQINIYGLKEAITSNPNLNTKIDISNESLIGMLKTFGKYEPVYKDFMVFPGSTLWTQTVLKTSEVTGGGSKLKAQRELTLIAHTKAISKDQILQTCLQVPLEKDVFAISEKKNTDDKEKVVKIEESIVRRLSRKLSTDFSMKECICPIQVSIP